MKFKIVDAFAIEIFGGNPAGVVFLEEDDKYPCEEVMRKTAAELRYSETVFIKKVDDNSFKMRYFTPTDEVDLCGHATIAGFGAMQEWGIVEAGSSYQIETMAGKLKVSMGEDMVFMEMAEPMEMGTIDSADAMVELAEVMGIKVEEIAMIPDMVSTGLPDIMLPVKSKEILNRMKPDFKALAELSKKYEVTGVHAFALSETGDPVANARNFAPLYDIDEEAATGTSTGAMTYYLYKKGKIEPDKENRFLQGEAMGRPSEILSRLSMVDEKPVIEIGGRYKVVASGEINLHLTTLNACL